MLTFLRKQMAQTLAQRATQKSTMDNVIAAAEREGRDLNETEAAQFKEARAAVLATDEKINDLRSRITEAEADEQRESESRALAAQYAPEARTETPATSTGAAVVTREERTYRAAPGPDGVLHMDPSGPSFFRDLVTHSLNLPGSGDARERLQRSRKEDQVESRALSTTDGAGGDFVPPQWLVNEYIGLARAARPTADRVRNLPLPTGTDSLNIPRLATGTAVAEQSTQNTAVQNTDATTNAVTAAVTTIAGQQVIALQLIEQSPINLDEILLLDLALDYAAKVDVFVLNNNVANKRGLLNVSGVNAVTYTQASPTAATLYPKLADATQQIYTGRFLPPDTILMHPRRWASLLASVDSQSRPLIVPASGGAAFNALGVSNGLAAQGVAGEIAGLPVVLDPNIPINTGAGTNQDPIVVFRAQDSILWEGSTNAEAFRETKADQLSVLLRFYRYVAFTGERYAKSISVINGTGLITPTF